MGTFTVALGLSIQRGWVGNLYGRPGGSRQAWGNTLVETTRRVEPLAGALEELDHYCILVLNLKMAGILRAPWSSRLDQATAQVRLELSPSMRYTSRHRTDQHKTSIYQHRERDNSLSETVLREYLGKVERDYKRGIATEHSYRGTLQDLLETLNGSITATNEPKRIKCGAPDYVIERGRGNNTFTIGYVEAKDVGKNLDEIERDARLNEPKTIEGRQLKRYLHALDNLVFTNYLEFRWYVQGEKRAAGCEAVEGSNRGERHLLGLQYAKLVQMQPVMYTVQHRT